MSNIVLLLLALQFKHLVVDWILQPPWMWKNKGTYLHIGGIVHSAFNAVTTGICFLLVTPHILCIIIIDFLVHYHIDWAKMNITRITNWKPTTHPEFWWLTGFDQYLHQVTYILLLLYV